MTERRKQMKGRICAVHARNKLRFLAADRQKWKKLIYNLCS